MAAPAVVAAITWAVIWIGGRFTIKELAKVTVLQLPKVFAHVKSVTKPVLKATNKNPRGVFRADGSLSRANHIIPVGQGTPFWNKTFREAAKNPKVANILTNFRAGMSKKKTIAALVGIPMVLEIANLLLENIDTDTSISAEESAKRFQRLKLSASGRYKEQSGDPHDIEVRDLPPSFMQRIAEKLGIIPDINIAGIDQIIPARREPVPAKPPVSYPAQQYGDHYRIAMEQAAIQEASPEVQFTKDELSPYRKIAEPGFGQKLFGLRRSKSEIDRDVRYTDLKMQGRDEEADEYWADWNAANEAKREAALGEGKSLTEYTRDDPTRETSFAEDIVTAAEDFSEKVKKKKRGGKVSRRPVKYSTMKKMYSHGGPIRKPKRLK